MTKKTPANAKSVSSRKNPAVKMDGTYKFRGERKNVHWAIYGNEAFFTIGTNSRRSPIGWQEMLDEYGEEEVLNLVGRMLAATRDLSADKYTSHPNVSIAIANIGGHQRVFWGATTSSSDQFERHCAERGSINQALQAVQGREEASIDAMFLMSGNEIGACNSSCAYCREESYFTSSDPRQSFFYSVPVFTVNKPLRLAVSDAKTVDEVNGKAGETFKASFAKMFPLSEIDIPRNAASGMKTETILKAGLKWVERIGEYHRPKKVTEHIMRIATKAVIEGGNDDPILQYQVRRGNAEDKLVPINRKLLNTIKLAKESHPKDSITRIVAVVVQTEDGKFYSGTEIIGDKLPTKTTAVMGALMTASNKKITKVYAMEYEPKYIYSQLAIHETDHKHSIEMKNFNGRDRERAYKNMATPADLTSLEMVRIPLNDGTLSGRDLESISRRGTMNDLYPDAFRNPKSFGDGHISCSQRV